MAGHRRDASTVTLEDLKMERKKTIKQQKQVKFSQDVVQRVHTYESKMSSVDLSDEEESKQPKRIRLDTSNS